MLHFQLFRIRIQESAQPVQKSFFYNNKSTSELLTMAIKEKPSVELRKGYTWHIGNISILDEEGFYFALGRTTSSIVELFDENRGDFIEEEFETAPYTHVLLDVKFQLCAIAAKPKLGPKPLGIARQLEKLLNDTKTAKEWQRFFNVSEINDPKDFISLLRSAYAICGFSMTFCLPNPFDVDQDFHAPMEKLLKEADGRRGSTSISGDNLNPNVLENLTRSSAAIGEDAKAKIKTAEGMRPIWKKLKGNPVMIEEEHIDSNDERKSFLDQIRNIYRQLRGSEGREGDQ